MSVQYVILVGGIGGNNLYAQDIPGIGTIRLWLDPVALLTQGWRLLGLADDGVSPSIPFGPRIVGRLLLEDYYDSLADWAASEGYQPVQYEQDWRLQLSQGIANLVAGIRYFGATQPVHVVAHSRGGLLLRAALNTLSADERRHLVGRCAGLGVPHQGSWEGTQLVGGCNETVRILKLVLGSSSVLASPLNLTGGIEQVIDTWPAPYELMPRPGAPGSDPDTILAVYRGSNWLAFRDIVKPRWLDAAYTRWLTAPDVPADVQWLDVVGVGQTTADQLRISDRPDQPGSYAYAPTGDGTVPWRWATQPGRPQVQLPVTHGELPLDGRVHSALSQWLREGRVG